MMLEIIDKDVVLITTWLNNLLRLFTGFNPLFRNVVKWPDILQESCSICYKIFNVCLTILRHCEVRGLRS